MPLPPLHDEEDLPPGVHRCTLAEVVCRFGMGSTQRQANALRLERIAQIAWSTESVARMIVYGSFVTTKFNPNDVDMFLLMDDAFEPERLVGEAKLLFDHLAAEAHFGASVFWMRRMAALGGEQAAVEHWQIKRDKSLRGIVEIISDAE